MERSAQEELVTVCFEKMSLIWLIKVKISSLNVVVVFAVGDILMPKH